MYIDDVQERDEDDQKQVGGCIWAMSCCIDKGLPQSSCNFVRAPLTHLSAGPPFDPPPHQTYYLPGLRAEKEVTRKRIVDYIENIFGEQMSKQERNRLLPTDEEETDEGIAAD
jgi:hypothetical protein